MREVFKLTFCALLFLSRPAYAERFGGGDAEGYSAESVSGFVPASAAAAGRPGVPPAAGNNSDVHRTGGPIGLAAILRFFY